MRGPSVQAKVAAGRVLTEAASAGSAGIERFSDWTLAGYAAGFALLLANATEAERLIPLAVLHVLAVRLLAAVALGAAQKYIAVCIRSAVTGAASGEEVVRRHPDLDLEVFVSEVLRGLPWGARWLARRSFAKARRGDFAAQGVTFARWALVQSLLALGVVVVTGSAILVLAQSLARSAGGE